MSPHPRLARVVPLVADLRRALAGRLVVCVTHDPAVAGEDDSVLALGTHTPAPARR